MSKRTDILDVAETLVRCGGYDAFSFADLATAVGIQKPSVHYYFATKGTLATDLITRYCDGMMQRLATLDEEAATRADKLRGFVAIYKDALGAGDLICLCAAMTAGRDSLPKPAQDALDTYHDEVLGWLEGTTQDAAQTAAALALVEGAQLLARARQDATLFDTAVSPFLAQLTNPTTH